MRRIAITEAFTDGQTIIKEGGYGEGTYVILHGKVEITKQVEEGSVKIALLEKGDILGEMSFVDKHPRSVSAVAIGDVKLGLIDKDFLEEEINKTSGDFRLILLTITERLRKTTFQLVKLIVENHKLKVENEKLNERLKESKTE
ncbi:MAG: cyclic nucleotide-binding domain-containing protein [Nitrospirae bacterium]|nr:cyclic nucleotide-binding domain-containing protein [Nitrospirota bacterium]